MAVFTPLDLYAIIYDIANSMPPVFVGGVEQKCARLQTAALVKDYATEVKTSNLGKDVRYMGKKIFFSRDWNNAQQDANGATWNYPALFYGEGLEVGLPQNKRMRTTYSFALSDRCEQNQQYVLNQGGCENRTYEEVGQALRTMWQSIHRTLLDYVYADLYMGSTLIASGWYSQVALQELLTSGAITSYTPDLFLSQYISREYEGRLTWDMHTENAVTYFISIDITFNECAPIVVAQPQENIPQPPTYDDETIAFADATGITDMILLDALDEHIVKGGKDDGWFNDCVAIWPLIGGTAFTHKFNLMAPTGLTADYTLSFINAWLHNAAGIKGNAIDTYANTNFIPTLNAPATNLTFGCNIATAESGGYIDMGCNGNALGSNNGQSFIAPNLSGTQFRACNSTGNNTGAGQLAVGLFTVTRDGTLAVKSYKNGVLLATDSQPNTTSDRNILLGGRSNNGTPNALTNRTYNFGFIALNFTDAKHLALSNRVAAFNAAIGR